ncbi:4'-phosphopantetheinyl transferase superfamily protein [Pseudoalteromonas translucida]|uniref:Orphan protein n=1 Tax=Pseudoalteromonas translucida (strain TAC 125) TaxID=326442 RepID=Q3IKT2_PSET1|nr:4'-phosphopantetheinyl transferase superfamily protein [Pseudoalteromonas translucida]CAI86326.1 putative orphan protein [Pseudoalteromonas translucida]|tara:strand:- start:49619 stop:50362 length:744 start_codon:yes stop_codon:yes gene_type:complete
MSSLYFKNTLQINQPFSNNKSPILLFDAKTLDISQYNLPDYLSPFELQIINRRKSVSAKQEYLATRLLLKYLVITSHPNMASIQPCNISSEFNLQTSKLALHINNSHTVINTCISHSNGFVGAALNPTKAQFGFDIEKISTKRPFEKLAKHFYHTDEIALITKPANAEDQAKHFFRIWTLKEALAKATSRPIAKLLSPNVFTELTCSQLNASSAVVGKFDISVVSEKSTDWQCSLINLAVLGRAIAL